MPFTAKTGETVVDLGSGQQFKVEGGDLQLDEKRYGRMGATNDPAGDQPTASDTFAARQGQVGPASETAHLPPPGSPQANDLLPSDIRRRAAAASAREATGVSNMLARNVGIPAAQAGVALMTGGASLPAQIAANVGAEAMGGLAQQALGGQGTSPGQMALAGGIPVAAKSVAKGLAAGGRLAGNLLGKGQQAGEQAIAKVVGVPGEAIERSTFKPAKYAYDIARQGAMVDTGPAHQAVLGALKEEQALGSQANRQTVRYLQGLVKDLEPAAGFTDIADPKLMTAKAQRLSRAADEAFRKKNTTLATTLREASDSFKAAIPGLKEADAAYTRQNVIDDIFAAARKSKKVEAIDTLLTKKGEKIRGVMSDKELQDIRLIASRMQPTSGAEVGLFKTGWDATIRSFLANPNGLTVFRHAFGPKFEKLTPERMAGIMTFARAYLAQQGGE